MTDGSWRPSLFQAAAQNHAYGRLMVATLKVLLSISLIPPLLRLVCILTDLLTDRMSIVALLLTTALTLLSYFAAFVWSTSDKARDEWAAAARWVLPLRALAASCLVARFLGAWLYVPEFLRDAASLFPTLERSVRLAGAVALLQVALVLRYISPISVMRLSAVPLKINPLELSTYRFWCRLTLPSLEPSEIVERAELSPPGAFPGRRFLHPSYKSLLGHVLVSLFVGLAVPPIIGLNVTSDEQRVWVAYASALSIMLTIPFPWSHELSFKDCKSFEKLFCSKTTYATSMLRAGLATLLALSTKSLVDPRWKLGVLLRLAVRLFSSCAIILFLVTVLDGYIKWCLFEAVDIERSIDDICSQSSDPARIHCIVQGIAYSSGVVEEIETIQGNDDRQERLHCSELSRSLGREFLTPSETHVETPFEEDLFRLSILEAMGGSRMLPTNKWLIPSPGDKNILIARTTAKAMCVLLGGLGESIMIAHPNAKRIQEGKHLFHERETVEEFYFLSSAFFATAEYALITLSRLVVRHMAPEGRVHDWRGFDLAPSIPASLQGIFTLRKGLLIFQEKQLGRVLADVSTAFELSKIIRLCDKTGKSILSCLRSPRTNVVADLFVDEECHLWIKELAR